MWSLLTVTSLLDACWWKHRHPCSRKSPFLKEQTSNSRVTILLPQHRIALVSWKKVKTEAASYLVWHWHDWQNINGHLPPDRACYQIEKSTQIELCRSNYGVKGVVAWCKEKKQACFIASQVQLEDVFWRFKRQENTFPLYSFDEEKDR